MRVGLFPGQGLDAATVLAGLVPNDPVLDRAGEILRFDIRRKVDQVAGRSRAIMPTSVAQPAIFLAGLIGFRKAFERGERFDYLVGHSLGEYTALVAACSIPFTQGLKLVAARGRAMQLAASQTNGGMAAVMNLAPDEVEVVCKETGVLVANDNSPNQVVLSGREDSLGRAAQMVRTLGGRAVLLPVDGAYHSPAMDLAAEHISDVLEGTSVRKPKIPVVSNVSATTYRAPGEVRKLLALQVGHKVRFRESILFVLDHGVPDFVDLGPGRVVARLAEATARTRKEVPVDA